MKWSFGVLLVLIASCQVAHKRGADTQKIIQQFEEKMESAKACARVLIRETRKSFSGEISLQWTVNDKGETLDPMVIKNTTGNEAVAICWLNYLKGLKFTPTPYRSTSTVEYTYEYTVVDH